MRAAVLVVSCGVLAAIGLIPVAATSPTKGKTRATRSASIPSPEQLVVTVPSGSLAISTSQHTLELYRAPGRGARTRYRGTLPNVQVVDTRASRMGWQVELRFVSPSTITGDLFVRPEPPIVVSGDRRGVHESSPGWTQFDTPVSLFGADMGSGAGTYRGEATVELVLPYSSDKPSVAVAFETSLS